MAYSGKYKGIRFRSLLELSTIIYFEKEGLVIGDDFTYETVKIPYGKTKIRNYIVDLAFPKERMLVEVKPESRAENKRNYAKRLAAEAWAKQNGWDYVIITDEILRSCDAVITLEQSATIDGVELNPRALRALRRKENRKKKRKK